MLIRRHRSVQCGKSLAVFLLLGPLVGGLSTGESVASGMPWVLVPLYVVGGFFALFAWLLYVAVMSVALKTAFVDKIAELSLLPIVGAIVGSLAGLIVFAALGCNLSTAHFGSLSACLIGVPMKFTMLSLFPGALCGMVASFFVRGVPHQASDAPGRAA